MIGTLFSIILALLLYTHPLPLDEITNYTLFSVLLLIIASLFVLIQTVITIYAWSPLQRLEKNLTPRIMAAFKNDRNLRFTNLILLIFLLFTYVIVIDVLFLKLFNPHYLLLAWTLSLGISLDFIHYHLKRIMNFLDPYYVIEYFNASAKNSTINSNESELIEWIDAFTEIALKTMTQNSLSLTILATNNLRLITKNYLTVAKSITYHENEDQTKFGGADHISYILFFIFQRLELVFDKALKEQMEPVCSETITVLGKICIYGAKYDITIANYPLHYIGKFAKKAQAGGLSDVGNRAMLTLVEISKSIISEVDMQYLEIKETFASVIYQMNHIAKDTFKNDRKTNIQVLIQPFHELKMVFKHDKVVNHRDTKEIISKIDSALGEFANLESVLSTLPPLSSEEKS